MRFDFQLRLLRPLILFYVLGATILFVIYNFTMGPQDGGFGTYALSLIIFGILAFLNSILNFVLAFIRKNLFYFVISFFHLFIFVVTAIALGVY